MLFEIIECCDGVVNVKSGHSEKDCTYMNLEISKREEEIIFQNYEESVCFACDLDSCENYNCYLFPKSRQKENGTISIIRHIVYHINESTMISIYIYCIISAY